MIITVFGLGFVGLTSALGFAEKGNTVYGIDADIKRAQEIKNGIVPFEEPGLDDALLKYNNKIFFVTDNVEKAILESDCVFYCVGTPYGEDGNADLTYLYSAIDETLKYTNDGKYRLLIVKSTVPPSTTKDKVIPYIEGKGGKTGEEIGVANNPEFLREGYCWEDFMNADRIVFGVCDDKSADILSQLYAPFNTPMFAVSLNTGEFIKYLSNTLLATLISYSNEMAGAAHKIGEIDIAKAFKILHLDGRWSENKMSSYVYPGCGYGGYCLPKDTNAFYSLMKGLDFDAKMLGNVIKTNDEMPSVAVDRITNGLDKEAKIGILGLSFKPYSDDVRDSSSAKIIAELINRGFVSICAYDPVASENFKQRYDLPIEYAQSAAELIKRSDVAAITTAWDEFKVVKDNATIPIVDCRYML